MTTILRFPARLRSVEPAPLVSPYLARPTRALADVLELRRRERAARGIESLPCDVEPSDGDAA